MGFGKLRSAFKSLVGGESAPEPALRSTSSYLTRAARVPVAPEHGLCLTLENLPAVAASEEFVLSNVSVTGVGFFDRQISFGSVISKNCRGSLRLQKQAGSVEIQVVHQNHGIVGARWISMDAKFKKALWEFLAPEKAGAECLRLKEELLQSQKDGSPLCYQGTSGNEFFAIHRAGSIIRLHLSLFGMIMDWNEGGSAGLYSAGKQVGKDRIDTGTAHELVRMQVSTEERERLLSQLERFARSLPGLEPDFLKDSLNAIRS
jgi:hypothetical protein